MELLAPPDRQSRQLAAGSRVGWRTAFGCIALGVVAGCFVAGAAHPSARPGIAGTLAFVSDRDGDAEIYVWRSGRVRALTRNRADDFAPAFSPDGHSVAFASDRDGDAEIYIMRADGRRVRRLTRNKVEDIDPAFSPDGKRVAFASNRHGGRYHYSIYALRVDGTHVRRVTRGNDSAPAFAPDGRIAFARVVASRGRDVIDSDLFVVASDGSRPRRLTRNRASDLSPAWCPDGTTIAFESNRDAAGPDLVGFDIYLVNADGSNVKRLTRDARADFAPAWSPDGRWIAFAKTPTRVAHSPPDIYVTNRNGSRRLRLTAAPSADYSPSWRP